MVIVNKMSVELNEVEYNLISKIAKDNGFDNFEVITNKGALKGDNFSGVLTLVTVKNDKDTLELILKSALQSEVFRKAAPLREAYLREIYLYENIFNAFKKYQERHNVPDIFDNYAKMYGSSVGDLNECLVMENLKTKGYQLWNKQNPMNTEHITTILKGYAKFHGTAIAMKHKDPELFETLTKEISSDIWGDQDFEAKKIKIEMYIKMGMEAALKIVEDEPDLVEFLKIAENKIYELFLSGFQDSEYKVSLIHGDCWCNNFMFKYESEDNTKPTSLKIIDWQLAHVNSPAYDYCYIYLAHSTKEVLEDYKSYLKLYHDALSQHLKSFNCDPDEVFPYSRFENHINRYMVLGLFMCFSILKIMLCDSGEAPDFGELKEGEDMMESFQFKFQNYDVYKERIKELIVFVKERDFISK